MTTRQELLAALDDLLQPARFKDYGPNGLQVEGRSEVRHIVSGVTASLALIDAAIAEGADAIFVHHGLFWRGQDGCITGWMRQRVARLLAHDINLFAYHLPLDAHPELGNNAQLGARLGLRIQGNFGENMLGCWGDLDAPLGGVDALAQQLQELCGRAVVAVDAKPGTLRRVGWCSGGAQGYFEAAIAAGVDVFITGEISEPQAHYARECGVSFIACGHHASERYGAPAVAGQVAQQLGIAHEFIDVDNPA